MADFSSFDQDRLTHVRRIVDAMYHGLVMQVIADIQALPDHCRQSGDDSHLKNVWEEFKYQIQREQSVMFDLYVHTIQSICAGQVAGLDRNGGSYFGSGATPTTVPSTRMMRFPGATVLSSGNCTTDCVPLRAKRNWISIRM